MEELRHQGRLHILRHGEAAAPMQHSSRWFMELKPAIRLPPPTSCSAALIPAPWFILIVLVQAAIICAIPFGRRSPMLGRHQDTVETVAAVPHAMKNIPLMERLFILEIQPRKKNIL